jgi:uncharacterized metal-binding protein
MKNLLPRVDPAIGVSLEHELAKKVDSSYIKEQLALIQEENPVISFWIENFAKKTRDKKGAIFCGLMVFKLLRIQAECDRMMSDIKL